MYDGDFVVTDVAADATPDRVARVTARQLHLLAAEGLFFHVESGPDMIAMLMDGECNFDTGPIGARLERDLKDRCTEISHPEDY